MIEVLRAGLMDLVMDLGRPGSRGQGVPAGGAADAPALVLANRLVGNADGAAGLELLLRGPTLRFTSETRIALTGADMQARLDGRPAPPGRTLVAAAGGELTFGEARAGLRAYLAVAGGIDVPLLLGSRATFLPGGFGGWQGRALKPGDRLPLARAGGGRIGHLLQAAAAEGPLRVVPGPQLAGFADRAIEALASARFSLTAQADRAGLRLAGPVLGYAGGEPASQAVLPGAIQVPPDGRPIILGWDGPVTGGYPVIAGIIAADLHRLAQMAPGAGLKFAFVTPQEARQAWQRLQADMDRAIAWQS